jgi:hypothetical protein
MSHVKQQMQYSSSSAETASAGGNDKSGVASIPALHSSLDYKSDTETSSTFLQRPVYR